MPCRRVGKTVYTKSSGKRKKKQSCKSEHGFICFIHNRYIIKHEIKSKMKKLFIIIFLAFCIFGCTLKNNNAPYIIPSNILTRLERINIEVSKCIQTECPVYISSLKKPNAWLHDGKIYFTEGLFEFDDDTLKFVMSHEIAHSKLGHIRERKSVSYATTGVMLVLNTIIPGAGILNWVVNPAVVNNFGKKQEFEADLEALRACECMGISKDEVIIILRGLQERTLDGGGFWDQHPSWEERVKNIEDNL